MELKKVVSEMRDSLDGLNRHIKTKDERLGV